MHWSGALIIGAALAIVVGCGPVIDRPLRGALPGSPAPTAPGLPPTLQPAEALRFRALPSPSPAASSSPSPGLSANPSAVASPSVIAAPPIVRTIVPAANGLVAPGAVTVSAVLVGRGADLASASLAINGADSDAQIDKRSLREWSIHSSQALPVGTYSARALVRDASGTNGGFTWQFTVGQPQPTPAPAPTP
jgi:hypothetical protein